MRIPKIYKLINLLTTKELSKIKRQLVRDKKERLSKLLVLLKKNTQKANFRAKIYQQLFNKPYDKSKDYKLRNEFRLLKEYLEIFLVQQHFTKRTKRHPTVFNYYLLQALQDRQALDLFQENFEKTQQTAIDTLDYYFAYKNDTLNFNNYAHFMHGKEKNLAVAEELSQSELVNLSSFYLNAYRDYQVHQTFLVQKMYPFSITEKVDKNVKVDFSKYENKYANYLLKKAQCYLTHGKDRIKLLEECLNIVQAKKTVCPNCQEEVKFCLSELAQQYHLLGAYDKAAPYYKAFFELNLAPTDTYRIAVTTDYIAKLLKQNRWSEAIKLIGKEEKVISTIEKYSIRLKCLKIAAFAFKKDTAALHRVLPVAFNNYSIAAKHFFILYFAIYFFLEG